jgi:glycerophosphoryl diester phosphodiesterase
MTRAWRTLDGEPPRIIAHRGASGLRPEHTEAAYALALAQGADVIEPDLVMSADGVLIVRHDLSLARSTDVVSQPAFSGRARGDDWRVQDFDRDELRALRAIQPFAQRGQEHDRRHPIMDFGEALAWAAQAAIARGRDVTLYPELKHPARLAAEGLDPVPAFVAQVASSASEPVRLWVQCFELDALRRVRDATGLPCFLLLDADDDWQAVLAQHAGAIDGVGVNKRLLGDLHDARSELVGMAHDAGLGVHAWTYRDDVLPQGVAHVHDELRHAFDVGVDALFCDFPATALALRDAR